MKKVELKINGMHCASCEVLIERNFKKIRGIEKVNVNHATGKATIYFSQTPQYKDLEAAVKEGGYSISLPNPRYSGSNMPRTTVKKKTGKDFIGIGATFLIIVAVYLVLKQFDFLPDNFSISSNMSYGFVFMIGLVAAISSCIAVTGGLLLAVAGKYNELNPNLNGYQKFKPHIYFNIGRIISYTLLGGAVGALGSVLTISTKATGFLTIFVSLIMVILGFQLLNLFPWLRRFQPKMPKFLAHRIHDASSSGNKGAPFFLGASTFFLPCGFTQALQLYILTTGNFTVGALTMLAFSLGTLPALISLGAISSFVKGAFQKHFLRFAGVFVVLLGLFNVNNGLALTGSSIDLAQIFRQNNNTIQTDTSQKAGIIGGKQIISMKITGLEYLPANFTVVQGIPVEWHVDGTEAQGCARVIVSSQLGIAEYLPAQGEKVISFTPEQTGSVACSCPMGMTTRGSAFEVVPNIEGIVPATDSGTSFDLNSEQQILNGPFQKVSLEMSRERGVYPNSFKIKKNIPVQLTIDAKVPLGGCMSVMVIPEYAVTLPMKLGENKTVFTPTKAGTIYLTCSMGSKMAQFVVE